MGQSNIHPMGFLYNNVVSKKQISVCQGIPEQNEPAPVARPPASVQATNPPAAQAPQPVQPAVPSGLPNANPLDLFPQVAVMQAVFLFPPSELLNLPLFIYVSVTGPP